MYGLMIWNPFAYRWDFVGGVFSDFASAARRADLLERATGNKYRVV